MGALRHYLRGDEVKIGDEVACIVPHLPYREGTFQGVDYRGCVRVQLWSSRLGRYAHGITTYSPSFIFSIPSPMERLDLYRGIKP